MQISVLHLADSVEFSLIVRGALRMQLGLYLRVQSKSEFIKALEGRAFDLVLASPSSTFKGIEALAHLRAHYPEIPGMVLTTAEDKRELLDIAGLEAWDVISTDELERLIVSATHAVEYAAFKKRQAELADKFGEAMKHFAENQRNITIGRLLGSIAHEINNPLEAISNLLYLVERNPSGREEEVRTWLRMAQDELHRVGEISKQVLNFHRDSKDAQEVVLHEAIESALVLYRARIERQRIEVVRQYRSRGILVAHPGELRQVFANLIANAIDAMADGGRLTLRIREHRGVAARVCTTIADTGAGIPRPILRRLGEPFFTTKGEAGTGLGMWNTRQLIAKYGGSLHVYSSTRPRRSGTAFSLSFSEPHARIEDASAGTLRSSIVLQRPDEQNIQNPADNELGERAAA